ncbi:MAG: AmmeMemoRadiSam system protein B [Candidatus Omnitrophota bacterium]
MLREPAVAGRFYPQSKSDLIKQITSFLPKKIQKKDVVGAILPHAGYIYSGKVAVETACIIEPKKIFIVIGPNHSGIGENFSIQTKGKWLTPLGEVAIEEYLASELLKNSLLLKEDSLAHKFEHSIEVELPILQYFNTSFKFIPIAIMSSDTEKLKEFGNELAINLEKSGRIKDIVIIASSDMTHYEKHEEASKKDKVAIDAILSLDADLLVKNLTKLNITMCGWGPAIILLSYAKKIKANKTKLIKYQTSAAASGDYNSVVGYAGIIITR